MTITQTSLALMLVASATFNTLTEATNLRQSILGAITYTSYDEYATLMLIAVNTQRATQGLSPLCLNKKLQSAAQRHSDDMAANNYMDHNGMDGSTMSDRITQAGYVWTAVAENVATGQVDVAAVMESWIHSPGHLKNIMGDYTMFAPAYAFNEHSSYLHYWTQDFASGDAEACDGTPVTTPDPVKTVVQAQHDYATQATLAPNPVTTPNPVKTVVQAQHEYETEERLAPTPVTTPVPVKKVMQAQSDYETEATLAPTPVTTPVPVKTVVQVQHDYETKATLAPTYVADVVTEAPMTPAAPAEADNPNGKDCGSHN